MDRFRYLKLSEAELGLLGAECREKESQIECWLHPSGFQRWKQATETEKGGPTSRIDQGQ